MKMRNIKMQYARAKQLFSGVDFSEEPYNTQLPSRVPSLLKIAEQFTTGKPLDASLNRNLDYNPIFRNPVLAKGVDLADLPEIAAQVGMTLQQATDEIDAAKVAQAQQKEGKISNPSETAPPSVPTE